MKGVFFFNFNDKLKCYTDQGSENKDNIFKLLYDEVVHIRKKFSLRETHAIYDKEINQQLDR